MGMRDTKGLDHEPEGPGLHCICSYQGTLGTMWPQWGWAFWREDIVGFVNEYTGGNCQKPLRGRRQDLN